MRFFNVLCVGLLILLFLIAHRTARADEWNTGDRVLFGTFVALQIADGLQAYEAHKQPDKWKEVNPLYGDPPTAERIIVTKLITTGLVYYLLDRSSPRGRRGALWLLDGLYLGVLAHNHYTAGVRIQFE